MNGKNEMDESGRMDIAVYSSLEAMKALGVEINDNVIDEIYRDLKKSFHSLKRDRIVKAAKEYKNNGEGKNLRDNK